jgi:hypothetical protein
VKNFTLLFFILLSSLGYTQHTFVYKSNTQQTFNLRVGQTAFQYVKMDKKDIVRNTLFDINDDTKKLVIPENGFYEISASFHFNPSTSVIKFNRGGVNFGIVQISENNETYVAATRKSFDQDNQDKFSRIIVYPTIVYLQKDVVIAPAISTGLIGNVLLSCVLGCDRKNKDCTAFSMEIKLISDEDAYQKYY